MRILEHVDELRARLIRVGISVMFFFIFCFTFGLKETQINGWTVYYPFPAIFDNISAQFLRTIQNDLVPSYVDLIQTAAGQAMIALIYISLFLSLILSMPVILTQMAKFISPGMYEQEKRSIQRLLIPAGILFTSGCLFSYFFITPFTIEFLYTFGLALDAETFIAIDSFISFVLMFILAFGFAFQLPILMYILTYASVVDDKFWIENLRYAIVGLLIFAAVITPDGTGITMTFVVVPMVALYLGGWVASRRITRRKERLKKKVERSRKRQ